MDPLILRAAFFLGLFLMAFHGPTVIRGVIHDRGVLPLTNWLNTAGVLLLAMALLDWP